MAGATGPLLCSQRGHTGQVSCAASVGTDVRGDGRLLAAGARAPGPVGAARPQSGDCRSGVLVAIGGGRSLFIYCVGTGSPTVILEAGLGGNIDDGETFRVA